MNENVRASAYIPLSALHGDLQTHLRVQYTTSALQTTFIRVGVCNRCVFCLSSFGCLFFSLEREGYLHSALSGETITAHLIPNWSWREDIRHRECSWTLTVATAVDVSISALYLMCLVRVVTCTAKKETTPPTHTLTRSQSSWMPTILDCSVFLTHPKSPVEPLILTDAQRLTQGYCGLIQRKSTVKHTISKRRHTHTHTQCWRMNGPTDRLNAAVLTNCWLQAGSSHEPEKGIVPLN